MMKNRTQSILCMLTSIALAMAACGAFAAVGFTAPQLPESPYDDTEIATRAEIMTPDVWKPYERRVRPTCWYDLFPEGDGRRNLTWKGRFANVTNTVNCIPSESFAVGANPVPAWGDEGNFKNVKVRNYDMGTLKDGVNDLPKDERKWVHSCFINRSFKRTSKLYKSIARKIKDSQRRK